MPPRKLDPVIEWKLTVPSSLSARVEFQLFDPVRGKPKYGARSALINQLLTEWVEKQEQAQKRMARQRDSREAQGLIGATTDD